MDAEILSCAFAMRECGMSSALNDPQAEWSALLNAARQSNFGALLKQMHTIAKLSGTVNYATFSALQMKMPTTKINSRRGRQQRELQSWRQPQSAPM